MVDFPKPVYDLGGVSLPMQNFSWSLVPGVQPYMTTFSVPIGTLSDQIAALAMPTYIRFEAFGGTEGKPTRTDMIFDNLYLLEPKQIDPYHVQWTIADTRWSWRGKKLFYSYNKTRKFNKVGIATTDNITPAFLRRPFDTFASGRYIPWTLKGNGEAVWDMREILEDQLTKLYIPFVSWIGGTDGVYVLENIEANGVDIYEGLAQLLAASRMQLGIKQSGEMYVYSVDYFDDSQVNLIVQYQDRARTRPGTLYMQEKKRMRPKKVTVLFEKKMEVRVTATDFNTPASPNFRFPISPKPPIWNQEDINNWRVIGCQNVIRCPYPVYSKAQARNINIGEFLPLWDYLQSLTPPILESEIRTMFFGDRLERYYANQVDGGLANRNDEQLIRHIISAIKGAYRRTYQIDPYLMDRIKKWEARRVAVFDQFSKYSPKSPLFSNYCVIPSRRHPSLAKRLALWDESAYNWLVDNRDQYRKSPTAGTISVIDEALGIFSVTYPGPVDTFLKPIIPSALDPLPGISVRGTLLEDCELVEDHVLDTIISIVWNNYKDGGYDDRTKYFPVLFDYSAHGGEGPEIEYFTSREYARLRVRELNTVAIGGGAIGGTMQDDPAKPTNEGLLDAIAAAEAGKMMNQFRNRYAGLVTLAGYVPVTLTGNMKGIIYSFSSKGMETTIDFRDTPPMPTIEQQVPQKVINYLRRQVPRGEDEVKT